MAVIFAVAASLAGCARGLPDPGLNVDNSITTASVSQAVVPVASNLLDLDTDTFRDGETIGNAVSSVQFSGKTIAWQNPATGSSGEILTVLEQRIASGALCRQFTVLRTSYDGIRNYDGVICMNDAGIWHLKEFSLR